MAEQLHTRNRDLVTLVGAIAVDLLAEVDRIEVAVDGWQRATAFCLDPGGISATALTISKLGARPAPLAWLGDDAFGSDAIERLAREDIDLDAVQRLSSPTTIVVALVDTQGQHSRVVLRGETCIDVMPTPWASKIQESAIVFLSGFSCVELAESVILEILELAEAAHSLVIFDPQPAIRQINTQVIRRILRSTHVLTANEPELFYLLSLADSPSGNETEYCKSLGVQTILIRRGDRGVTICSERAGPRIVPAFCVDTRNTLGAGDCFNGAVLFGLAKGLNVDDIAILGNAVAALKVMKSGTGGAVPNRPEVQRFLINAGLSETCEKIWPGE